MAIDELVAGCLLYVYVCVIVCRLVACLCRATALVGEYLLHVKIIIVRRTVLIGCLLRVQSVILSGNDGRYML